MNLRNALGYVVVLVLALACARAAGAHGKVELGVEPEVIRVGAFYDGEDVRVTARVVGCDNVVFKVEGKTETVSLNRKGRVVGVWLNVAHVTVKNAPQVYILASSGELRNICSQALQDTLGLGLHALRRRVVFESNKPLTGEEFDEFLRLKEHRRTYSVSSDATVAPGKENAGEFSAVLHIPTAMPTGLYQVQAYCFDGQRLSGVATAPLSIENVGIPRLTTALAFDHAALHGVLAIVVAIAAGITMGIIFSSKAGREG